MFTYTEIKIKKFPLDPFYPLRYWVDKIKVTDEKFARFLCNLIPCTCHERKRCDYLGKNLSYSELYANSILSITRLSICASVLSFI